MNNLIIILTLLLIIFIYYNYNNADTGTAPIVSLRRMGSSIRGRYVKIARLDIGVLSIQKIYINAKQEGQMTILNVPDMKVTASSIDDIHGYQYPSAIIDPRLTFTTNRTTGNEAGWFMVDLGKEMDITGMNTMGVYPGGSAVLSILDSNYNTMYTSNPIQANANTYIFQMPYKNGQGFDS